MKKVLLFLLVLVVGLAAFVATRPDTFRVERSTTIAAPAHVVQSYLDDFHAWNAWSPWENLDPNLQRTFDGPPSGVGAVYSWVGNDKVGEGRMTITDVQPGSRVEFRLEFLKPWAATSQGAFALAPEGDGTKVTWTMEGKNDFLSKAMHVFMNPDKMIGTDFEKGLASLKTVAESAAAQAPADTTASEVTAP